MTPRPDSAEHTRKPDDSPSSEQVDEGLSAFLGRVFDQLSVTCWLPAVFFVGNAAVLLALQGKERLDLTDAVEELVRMHWGAVVVLLFAVIIVAIVIQAFDFENLRFWEGYLRSRPLRWWGALRIRAFQKKLTRLTQAFDEQRLSAFDDARRRALDDSTTKPSEQAM